MDLPVAMLLSFAVLIGVPRALSVGGLAVDTRWGLERNLGCN